LVAEDNENEFLMKLNTHLTQSLPTSFKKPTLSTIISYLLAGILAFSGIAKLVDASGLLSTLQQLSFLNEAMTVWTATLLPIIEIGLAVALFLQWKPRITLATTTLLFAGFLSFAVYGFYMGMAGDCSCFGNLVESRFGRAMLIRNGIFLSLSIASLVIYHINLRKRD